MQRALVIRMHGNSQIGTAIRDGMESPELKRLRGQVEADAYADSKKYRKLIASINRRFPIPKHGRLYHAIWGYIGLIWLLITKDY